jgi:glycosyltransferase involved in cell wall biosynthesis
MTSTQSHHDGSYPAGDKRNGRTRAAIIYQILHHFRDPIFSRLVNRGIETPSYHFVASRLNDVDSNRTIDPSRADLPLEEGGLPWTFLRNRPLGGPFLWQSGVLRTASKRGLDTIIFLGNMYYLSTWVAAIVARLTGKRVLFWGHAYTRREANLKGSIRKLFYRLAHGSLVYGDRAKNFLVDRGFSANDIYVVYNSLDYARQRAVRESTDAATVTSLRSRLFENADLPTLVCIGRLDPRKHLDQLIELVSKLESRDLSINVLIIGDGEDRAHLEALSAEKQTQSRVCIYGACYDEEEIGPLLMSSTLCVCPGHVGLTAIHAMAYGVPVISHGDLDDQAPEVEAILPGETGDLYQQGSGEDMTDRIESWLRTHPNRDDVAHACIRMIEDRYNPDRQSIVIDGAVRGIPADRL